MRQRYHDGDGLYAPNLIKTPDGMMTRKEAAAFYKIKLNTLHGRIFQGVKSPELFAPVKVRERAPRKRQPYGPALKGYVEPTYVTAWGVETIKQAAERMGMTHTGLWDRVNGRPSSAGPKRIRVAAKPWSLEEAFNTPSFGVRGQQFILPPEEYRARVAAHQKAVDAEVHGNV